MKTIATRLRNKLNKWAIACAPLLYSKKRHFTFIIDKNDILSIGHSDGWKTHPIANRYNHRFDSIHSELHAITKLKKINQLEYPKLILVNIRVMLDGSIGPSKPCLKCQKLLSDFGFRKIWYTDSQGDFTCIS